MSLALDTKTGSLVKIYAEGLGVSRGEVLRRAVRRGLADAAQEIRQEQAEAAGGVPHVVEAIAPGDDGRWHCYATACDERQAKELLETYEAAAPDWKWRIREARP